jgi:hypothetical protein
MQVFLDKYGQPIQAGDTIRCEFYLKSKEFPGRKRVIINSMNYDESIVPDEGEDVLDFDTLHFIEREVKWSGACLIAERANTSDFNALCQGTFVDADGNHIRESIAAIHYLNAGFKSQFYEVL